MRQSRNFRISNFKFQISNFKFQIDRFINSPNNQIHKNTETVRSTRNIET